jgi:hypothetical protein
MVQQAQPAALLHTLLRESGLSQQDLEQRARQSKLGYAAQVAALQDGCDCRACRLLRQTVDSLVDEAMKEIAPPPARVPGELVEAPPSGRPE